MIVNKGVPKWMREYAMATRDLLGLHDWTITLQMSDATDDDKVHAGQAGADCEYNEPYRLATITFRRGHSRPEYEEFIMHELLHLSLAPLHVAALLLADLSAEVVSVPHEIGRRVIDDGLERSITPLARALARGIKPPEG